MAVCENRREGFVKFCEIYFHAWYLYILYFKRTVYFAECGVFRNGQIYIPINEFMSIIIGMITCILL